MVLFVLASVHFRISFYPFKSCGFSSVAWPTGVQLVFFFCSGFNKLFGAQRSESSILINHGGYHDLFVYSFMMIH